MGLIVAAFIIFIAIKIILFKSNKTLQMRRGGIDGASIYNSGHLYDSAVAQNDMFSINQQAINDSNILQQNLINSDSLQQLQYPSSLQPVASELNGYAPENSTQFDTSSFSGPDNTPYDGGSFSSSQDAGSTSPDSFA